MFKKSLTGRRIAIAGRSIRDHAGTSRIILGLTRALADEGHGVCVYGERLDHGLVRRYGGQPRNGLPLPMRLRFIRQLVRRERPGDSLARRIRSDGHDLVIGNGNLPDQDILLVHNVVRCEAEVLGHAGPTREAIDDQDRLLLRGGFRLLVANSRLMKKELCRHYPLDPERVTVIHPAVDAVQFTGPVDRRERDRLRQALHLDPRCTVIGFITSGHYRLRGVDILAETVCRLPPEIRATVRVLAVAGRSNAELIHRVFAERGLLDSLIVTGKMDRIQDCFHAIDLLFHPALFESFGLVVAEAAASGCPVLTSGSVGAAELFEGEARLGVVERPSPASFLPVLDRLVRETALRETVARSQRQALESNSWPAYADLLMKAAAGRHLL